MLYIYHSATSRSYLLAAKFANKTHAKGGGTGGARGAIAPPLFTDHLKIINYSDTQNGS